VLCQRNESHHPQRPCSQPPQCSSRPGQYHHHRLHRCPQPPNSRSQWLHNPSPRHRRRVHQPGFLRPQCLLQVPDGDPSRANTCAMVHKGHFLPRPNLSVQFCFHRRRLHNRGLYPNGNSRRLHWTVRTGMDGICRCS
jgi:hypothetical protein